MKFSIPIGRFPIERPVIMPVDRKEFATEAIMLVCLTVVLALTDTEMMNRYLVLPGDAPESMYWGAVFIIVVWAAFAVRAIQHACEIPRLRFSRREKFRRAGRHLLRLPFEFVEWTILVGIFALIADVAYTALVLREPGQTLVLYILDHWL